MQLIRQKSERKKKKTADEETEQSVSSKYNCICV